MAFIGLDLGATKVNSAMFPDEGEILTTNHTLIRDKKGVEVGLVINDHINIGKSLGSEHCRVERLSIS